MLYEVITIYLLFEAMLKKIKLIFKKDIKKAPPRQDKTFIDPVCGMSTDQEGKYLRLDYEGKPYYFCGKHCLEKFKNDPETFGAPAPKTKAFIDPVCGMSTDQEGKYLRFDYEGKS